MRAHSERYAGYTLRQVCNEMHEFYREANVKELQRLCFRAVELPGARDVAARTPTKRSSRTKWTTCRSRASAAASPRRWR